MLTALLLILSVAQAPDGWRVLSADDAATVAWRLAEDDAGGGDVRRWVLRVTAIERPDWMSTETILDTIFELDCTARTSTAIALRARGPAGALVRAVDLPEDLREPEMFDDAAESEIARIYAELCPAAAPLAARSVHPPPMPVPQG